MTAEAFTVADDMAVVFDGAGHRTYDGLQPATDYDFDGASVTTLDRPGGEWLCTFATVNDVHFGETECGRISNSELGPILSVAPGERPYPLVMNEGAVAEIAAIAPIAVFAKGDLTNDGQPEEWDTFRRVYGVFGDRLHVVRGNHDSYRGQAEYTGDTWIDLAGVAVALVDTARPGQAGGAFDEAQAEWLADRAAASDRPVVVLGHHPQWRERLGRDTSDSMDPVSSDRLASVIERGTHIVLYAAGHTHRFSRHETARGVPTVEVGCVKDYPGAWAEYRVYEGGLMQLAHRVASPEALAWSERCRGLYREFGIDYGTWAAGRITDRCFTVPFP